MCVWGGGGGWFEMAFFSPLANFKSKISFGVGFFPHPVRRISRSLPIIIQWAVLCFGLKGRMLSFSIHHFPTTASSRWTSHVTSNWTVKDYTVTLILVSL